MFVLLTFVQRKDFRRIFVYLSITLDSVFLLIVTLNFVCYYMSCTVKSSVTVVKVTPESNYIDWFDLLWLPKMDATSVDGELSVGQTLLTVWSNIWSITLPIHYWKFFTLVRNNVVIHQTSGLLMQWKIREIFTLAHKHLRYIFLCEYRSKLPCQKEILLQISKWPETTENNVEKLSK